MPIIVLQTQGNKTVNIAHSVITSGQINPGALDVYGSVIGIQYRLMQHLRQRGMGKDRAYQVDFCRLKALSNTITLDELAAACSRIRQLSIAELIAESIRRISHEESIGDLFMD